MVDVVAEVVEVHTESVAGQYTRVELVDRKGLIGLLVFADLEVLVDELFAH